MYNKYMHKEFYIALGTLAVLVAAFFAVNSYIYTAKQGDGVVESYRGTLSGEYVCLPHKDTSGPQTDECAFGLKTDTGEYYAVDFALMSQTAPQLAMGERFSANGVITPIEMLSSDHWRIYDIKGIFSVTDSFEKDGPYACNADAKICPDGSSVGRTGPQCEFAACPPENATSGRVTTYMGGTATTLNVTVSPQALISDSRCPVDVQCVWAGTVEVRTVLSTQVAHGEHTMKLNEPQNFGDFTVTLLEVSPAATQGVIPESSYRFTYEVKKR